MATYTVFKKRNPNHVLIYIEQFCAENNYVLVDFIDSKEHQLFYNLMESVNDFKITSPSMIYLINYKGKKLQENTVYSVNPENIVSWIPQINQPEIRIDSYIVGYVIDCTGLRMNIFGPSISFDINSLFELNMFAAAEIFEKDYREYTQGNIKVLVRDIGQGNWNEIYINNVCRYVFDIGAPFLDSVADVQSKIGNRNLIFSENKPMLIISHWDIDHYHALVCMDKDTIKNNFCGVICRDLLPTKTSRITFAKVKDALLDIGVKVIPAMIKMKRGIPVFKKYSELTGQIDLFNSEDHKDRNKSGIAVSIKTENSSIVLSGDAHYEQISNYILPTLNYPSSHHLIVPHHGGKAGKFVYETPNGHIKMGKAVISVGKNYYNHPDERNKTSLRNIGFKVLQTNIKGDIEINMN